MSAIDQHINKAKTLRGGEKERSRIQADAKPDYILVYRISKVSLRAAALMEEFLRNLVQNGIVYEAIRSTKNADVVFIKLFASLDLVYELTDKYFIDLACDSADFKLPVTKPSFKFMRNELNDPTVNGVVYKRAPEFFNITQQTTITPSEKSLVVYTLLMETRFGKGQYDYGLEKLVSKGIFESGYPLHDGDHHWTKEGPLNLRQLLKKYWSSLYCFFKQQPLDVIHHYSGPETSFYFAFLGFYNKMLIPASIAGIFFFVLGLFTFQERYRHIKEEICHSPLLLCPKCLSANCRFEKLTHSCFLATYSYVFDNPMTFFFATLISVWAAVVMRLWKREENVLRMKWDLRSVDIDDSMRYGYLEKATRRRISPFTGEIEPCVPKKTQIGCYMLSCTIMLGLVAFNVFSTVLIMLLSFRMSILIIKGSSVTFFRQHASSICSLLGMIVSAIFVKIFGLLYHRVTLWLTNIENPRSQIDFDNSFIYKIYILAFVNNYSTVFYNAFFKGKFFTHPGDAKKYQDFFGIATDQCDPSGCVLNLSMYIVISMVFTQSLWVNVQNLGEIIYVKMRNCFKRNIQKTKTKEHYEHQWENDYLLRPIRKLDILEEYLDLAIQHGFVTFFVACFPLAPVIALIHNLVQIRLDAKRRLVVYRRSIPFKVTGMGAWNGIFQASTLIGIVTNAMVITFTSEFISKEVYMYLNSSLKGYVKNNFSLFMTKDYGKVEFDYGNIQWCFFQGLRFNPAHEKKYQPSYQNDNVMNAKLIFVILFEHILFFLNGLIAYCISTTPFHVEQMINKQEQYHKDLRSLATGMEVNKSKSKSQHIIRSSSSLD